MKKLDKYILFVIIVILLLLFLYPKTSGSYANIKKDNEIIQKINLNENNKYEVDDLFIEVKDGKVAVVKADCKNKICEKSGYISYGSIICLPNKLEVEVIEKSENIEVTY